MNKVREAESASRALGRPYNANVDPPAKMVVNKNTAKFLNVSSEWLLLMKWLTTRSCIYRATRPSKTK